MTVYIDDAFIQYGRMKMCHLMSDEVGETHDEIHQFASGIGLKKSWFHNDHYDVSISKRELAIQHGAVEISKWEMLNIRRKKKGLPLLDLSHKSQPAK